MFCPQCGSDIKEEAKFCPKCGCRIQEDVLIVNTTSKKRNTRKKKKVGTLLTVVLALVLIVGGAAVYKTWSNKIVEEMTVIADEDTAVEVVGDDEWGQDTYVDDSEEEVESEEEKGEVVYVCEKEIYYGVDGYKSVHEYKYDDRGNQTKHIFYDADGNITEEYEYEYDAWGNQVKEICYDAKGDLTGKYEHEYDIQGNEIKFVTYHADGSIDEWSEYEYDSQGNKIKSITYHANGSIDTWMEWNQYGDIIKEKGCYADNTEYSYEYQYEYDEWGNHVKVTCYDEDGSVINLYEYQYEYDEQGNVTEWYMNGEVIGTYEYDEEGNLVVYLGGFESIFSGCVMVWNQQKEQYDKQENVIKRIWYDTDGNIDRWSEYEYDSQGDMKKIIEYDEEGEITSWREYEYVAIEIPPRSELYESIEERENVDNNEIYVLKEFSVFYLDGSLVSRCEYEYDYAGKELKETWFDKDGNVSQWYECEYENNLSGHEIKKLYRYSENTMRDWDEYEYDEYGRLIIIRSCDKDGSVNKWIQLTYDEDGKISEGVETHSWGVSNKYTFEYDIMGRCTKWMLYNVNGGGITHWTEFQYDENGNRVREIVYKADGSLYEWKENEYVLLGTE